MFYVMASGLTRRGEKVEAVRTTTDRSLVSYLVEGLKAALDGCPYRSVEAWFSDGENREVIESLVWDMAGPPGVWTSDL